MFARTRDPRQEAARVALGRMDSAAECLHTLRTNPVLSPALTAQATETFRLVVELLETATTENSNRTDRENR
ncbi:hypothetical protein [Promicromonospora sp. NPDC050880]|uniref:hypothetical protein n=1 Tax=Promicromonospora sp. NPDC050880 TaxID=3364406 RepID=UPI00379919B8